MGRPKLLLPLGGSTVLEHVLSMLRSVGLADTLVVVAPDADVLEQHASAGGAHVLRLEADTPDMRATCQQGLAWIEAHCRPHADDGWLLLPADHPTVRPEVVRALVAAAESDLTRTIVVPTSNGKRGHPTFLRWTHASVLRTWPADQGLNAYIRAHAADTRELAWPTDEILRDLDTPDDYARLLLEQPP